MPTESKKKAGRGLLWSPPNVMIFLSPQYLQQTATGATGQEAFLEIEWVLGITPCHPSCRRGEPGKKRVITFRRESWSDGPAQSRLRLREQTVKG